MKKFLTVLIPLLLVALAFAGCATDQDPATGEDVDNPVNEEPTENPDVTVDGINHIVFFESNIASLTPVDGAYSLADFVEATFNNTPSGEVTIAAADGYKATGTAEEVLALSVTLEGEDAPALTGEMSNPGLAVKNVLYIQFANEVIYFVESDFAFGEVVTNLGLDSSKLFTFAASDGFEWPAVDAEDVETAEVKCPATTGSSVNVFFYSMGDQGADLRDCVSVSIQ